MKRVAIVGSPGTGKSTFARELAAKTGLPLIHLDYYYHDARLNYYTDKATWRARADRFTEAKCWIIDGNFGATMAQRLKRSDTIYYFDMPTHVALKGILNRWLTARRTKRSDVPDGWQEKPSWSFFWKVMRFRHNYAAGTRQLLADNRDKTIIVFKNHRQVTAYLENS